jgi:hypothetical protein
MTINNTTLANVVYPVANAGASTNPFVDIFLARDPTGNDTQYPIQKKWLNTSTGNYFALEKFTSTGGVVQAVWIKFGGTSNDQSLTGNTGGAVFPTANNINVVGDGLTVSVVGNPATSTLTIEVASEVAITYDANSGSATASGGILNVLGGTGATTVGSGNTITINSTAVAVAYTNVTHAMSPYTVLAGDEYISVDCSGGAVTLLFPNAPATNRTWTVKDRTGNAATNNITLTTVGGAVNIDGATSYVIKINYTAVDLLANSTPTYEVF